MTATLLQPVIYPVLYTKKKNSIVRNSSYKILTVFQCYARLINYCISLLGM